MARCRPGIATVPVLQCAPMGETAYLLANASVLPVWALMVFVPAASVTQRLTATPAVPALYAVGYALLLIGTLVRGGDGDMASLDGLRAGFERDAVLLMAWLHYLCFDMVVGMWICNDARSKELSWRWVGPCLVGTLMAGPVGWLCYLVGRRAKAGATGWG